MNRKFCISFSHFSQLIRYWQCQHTFSVLFIPLKRNVVCIFPFYIAFISKNSVTSDFSFSIKSQVSLSILWLASSFQLLSLRLDWFRKYPFVLRLRNFVFLRQRCFGALVRPASQSWFSLVQNKSEQVIIFCIRFVLHYGLTKLSSILYSHLAFRSLPLCHLFCQFSDTFEVVHSSTNSKSFQWM